MAKKQIEKQYVEVVMVARLELSPGHHMAPEAISDAIEEGIRALSTIEGVDIVRLHTLNMSEFPLQPAR